MVRGLAFSIVLLALAGVGLAFVKPWGWPRGDLMRLQAAQAADERISADKALVAARAEIARTAAAKAETDRLAAIERDQTARKLADLETHIKSVMARAVDADRALTAATALAAQQFAKSQADVDESRKELARTTAARDDLTTRLAAAQKDLASAIAARDDLTMRLTSTQTESERAIAEAREEVARARAGQPGNATEAEFEKRLAAVRTEAAERFMAARNEADRQITTAQAEAAQCRAELEKATTPPAPSCPPAATPPQQAGAEPTPPSATPVAAAEIAQQITTSGRIALYVPFDTASAVVKPNAYPSIEPIAAALRQDPKLKLLLVGHTDSQGDFNLNRTLSENRAKAIVDQLIAKHGIDRARLAYAGVADLAPIASNDTEAGRQRNRRVELIKR